MPSDNPPPARHRRTYAYAVVGCTAVVLIIIGLTALTYSFLKTGEFRTPLVLALPDCKAGMYTKPATEPIDLFDDVGNDAAKRACDGTKGFQGEAVLSSDALTLKIHNSDSSPLVSVHVRLIIKPKFATPFQREYRLTGTIPPLSDGELMTQTNLDPRNVESLSAFVTWVYFEG